jgi:hypothetical protein
MPKRTRATKTSDEKGNKPWLRRSKPYAYALNSRAKNRSFLIVCEGQTEEQYFNSFPVLAATVKPIHAGSSKTVLVDAVKKYMRGQSYDEVWCVFDLDFDPGIPGQVEDFNRAIRRARELSYHCAYSNDSFELWFVLHYQYLDQQQHRDFYCELLSRRWDMNYTREGKVLRFARGIYTLLQEDREADQQKAIDHARKLLASHETKPYHLQNPVTTAFQLVERLNEYCRK